MLKFSKRYLKLFLNNHWFTEKFLTASALVQAFCLSSAKIAWTKADVDKNFLVNWWLFKNGLRYLFEIFSIVNHVSPLIWDKNFGHGSIGATAVPSFMLKLWKPLAAAFVEIFSKKFFGGGFRPKWVTQWQEFEIFPKKWRFWIFWVAAESRWI